MTNGMERAPTDTQDIKAIAAFVQGAADSQVSMILPARIDEFQRKFEEVGDLAYGQLNAELFKPVRDRFAALGLKATPRLPGSFQRSREWGNEDETHQQRWMWSIISQANGQSLGALAVGSHHDHTRFRLPRSPEILAIAAVTPSRIVAEISRAHPQFGEQPEFRQWYASYLQGQQ